MKVDPYLLMALLPLVLIPPLIYYRQRVYRKKSQFVSVQCPHCNHYQDIKGVQNYTCSSCNEDIRFFEQDGSELENVKTYNCIHCDQKNFVGMLTCVSCGLTSEDGIPNQVV